MCSDKYDLNFSVSNTIMKNCVKRANLYDPAACETAKNDNIIPSKNKISHNGNINLRLTPCDASSKYLTKLHEEIDQKVGSENKIETDEEILWQDICQNNALDKWSLSRCDKNDSSLSLMVQLTEKENSSTGTAEILEKYFAICDTILLPDNDQRPIDLENDVTVELSRDSINETQDKVLTSEDSVSLTENKLTLILPRCNCTTNSEQSKKFTKGDQKSEESNKKSEYIIVSASVADICWNDPLHDANDDETLDEELEDIHSLKKQDEERSVYPCPNNENMCQRISASSFNHTTEEQAQFLSKECNVADTATEQLANELLILIRQMYHTERSMLYIGLIDVISSMEQNLAEFIVLADDATHLMSPLDFLTRLTKLAEAKSIPYTYLCKKKQLGQACCISTGISAISIKIGPSYFSEEIKRIKDTMNAASRKSSVAS